MYLKKEILLTVQEGAALAVDERPLFAAQENFGDSVEKIPTASGGTQTAVKERPAINTAAAVKAPEKEKEIETVQADKTAIKRKPFYDFLKRAFDIFCSVFGLIFFSPIFLAISIKIKLDSSGKNVFFSQKRVGKNGKAIYIHKFRSMVDNAENVEQWLTKEQLAQYYGEFKIDGDPRVTKFGWFLRRTGLDELPQLVNILKGELSLVGPRPIQECELEFYGEDRDLLLSVKPGLTGYWQAYCSDGISYHNHKRQEMELTYVKKRSVIWDLKICFATFGAIVRKAKRGQ